MADHSVASRKTDRSVLPARVGILAYGIGSYLLGVAALVAVILVSVGSFAFTGGPVHIANPVGAALFNVALLVLFAVQHSVMARAAFKERWTRIIAPSMERSTFVLATAAVLLPLVALWQPIPAVVWSFGPPLARAIVIGIGLLGWAYLFAATFAIDHFELFGLQQSWRGFRGWPPVPVPFQERWMYRFDRHPIMTGVLVGLWATPEMTLGHLLFVAGLSAYVVIGVYFEERALRRQWGDTYESYRRRVPSLVPTVHSTDSKGQGDAASQAGTAGRMRRAFTATTRIDAPPERVWALMADVLHWPDWLPTMTAVEPLDSPALALGTRYRIVQPRLMPTIWTVVRLEPLRAFAWESRAPGVRALADHSLSPMPDGSTSVTLRVQFLGPLYVLARVLAGSLTREYLAREAAWLKTRVEANFRAVSPNQTGGL
ncbi:MAG: NnrU family protein [Vicinamibacterales bacterium]